MITRQSRLNTSNGEKPAYFYLLLLKCAVTPLACAVQRSVCFMVKLYSEIYNGLYGVVVAFCSVRLVNVGECGVVHIITIGAVQY